MFNKPLCSLMRLTNMDPSFSIKAFVCVYVFILYIYVLVSSNHNDSMSLIVRIYYDKLQIDIYKNIMSLRYIYSSYEFFRFYVSFLILTDIFVDSNRSSRNVEL